LTHLLLLVLLAGQPARAVSVTVTPPEPAQGQVVLVELSGGEPGDRISGTLGPRRLRFFVDARHRVRALGGVRLDESGSLPLVVEVTPPGAEPVIHGLPIPIRPGEFEQQKLEVDPRFVRPPAKARARIRRESRRIRKVWQRKPTPRAWRGDFAWPRRDAICSTFGLKRMFNGALASRHHGVDIDGKVGQPVAAIGTGTVVMVSRRYYSGGTVVVDHGLRLYSLYFHLSAFSVREGERVAREQIIGAVGRSGRVTGPHLHLGVWLEGHYVDPLSLLALDLDEDPEKGS